MTKRHACAAVPLAVVTMLLTACPADPLPGPWPVDGACGSADEVPYSPYRPLMERSLCDGALLVTGSDAVDSNALIEARRQLDAPLRRDDIVDALVSEGALVAVFPRDGDVCGLPYFADLEGTPHCDARGGLGGVPGRPASACSERNLLGLWSDEFRRGTEGGENVCIHEIAHLVMNVGVDAALAQRIQAVYVAAMQAGLWEGTYAATNADEYFAELAQSWFRANPERPNAQHNGVNGPEALRGYDPEGFALMEEVFEVSADLR